MKRVTSVFLITVLAAAHQQNGSDEATRKEREIAQLTNQVRKKQKLSEMKYLDELAFIGREHAQHMDRTRQSNHKSKTWGYTADRVKEYYGWTPAIWTVPSTRKSRDNEIADNEAVGPMQAATAQRLVDGWLNSPGHKAAMLSKGNVYTGVGMGTVHTYFLFAALESKLSEKIDKLQDLYQKLKEKDEGKVLDTIKEISGLNEPSSSVPLAYLFHSSNAKIRSAAVDAIISIHKGNPKAKSIIPIFFYSLNNPDRELRDKMQEYVHSITKQNHATLDAWLTWWDNEGKKFQPK
jgi:uncharacterized protein YkwD